MALITRWLQHLLGRVGVPNQKVGIYVIDKANAHGKFDGLGGKGIEIGLVEGMSIKLTICPSVEASFHVRLQLTLTDGRKVTPENLRDRLSKVSGPNLRFSAKYLSKPRFPSESQYQQLVTGGTLDRAAFDERKQPLPQARKRKASVRLVSQEPKLSKRQRRELKTQRALKEKPIPSPWELAIEQKLKARVPGIDDGDLLVLMDMPYSMFAPADEVMNYSRVVAGLRRQGLHTPIIIKVLTALKEAGMLQSIGGKQPPGMRLIKPTVGALAAQPTN
jgi:hypothetical protein